MIVLREAYYVPSPKRVLEFKRLVDGNVPCSIFCVTSSLRGRNSSLTWASTFGGICGVVTIEDDLFLGKIQAMFSTRT